MMLFRDKRPKKGDLNHMSHSGRNRNDPCRYYMIQNWNRSKAGNRVTPPMN